jgi:hypothetical protein
MDGLATDALIQIVTRLGGDYRRVTIVICRRMEH